MKIQKLIVVLVWLLFLFSACSMFENKPSENDLRKTLAEDLPGYMEISDIKIQAMENMGSKVEPKYHSRYIVKIKLLKPTYEKIGYIGGNVDSNVVRLVLDQNTTIEVFGKAISVLKKDKWSTRITNAEFSIENCGKLLGKFLRPVIEDSSDHEAAKQKFKEWELSKAEKMKRLSAGFSGKWKGTYICGQGRTGLTLTISTSSNSIDAVFAFYPTKEKPYVKKGSFSLTGRFFEDGTFKLEPKVWINRPKGYGMVGVSGKINSIFNELEGLICNKGFQLQKQEI